MGEKGWGLLDIFPSLISSQHQGCCREQSEVKTSGSLPLGPDPCMLSAAQQIAHHHSPTTEATLVQQDLGVIKAEALQKMREYSSVLN